MSTLGLTWKSMRHRKSGVILTIVSLALGVALLLGVEKVRNEAKDGFTNTISGTDIIVGARSGSLSLLLTSVFHIGYVSDNVSWETFKKIERNPQVAWTIPLSLGDTHKGFAVLGTSNAYFDHYRYGNKQNLGFSQGGKLEGLYHAVIGSEVAKKLGYEIGQKIIISHGSGEISFLEHDDDPFTVVGILKPTGTPVDQTVHVSLEGIEAVHINMHGGSTKKTDMPSMDSFDALLEAKEEAPDYTPKSITAFLVGMKSRPDALALQRAINQHPAEALTGVLPGIALSELWQVVGVIENILLGISALVLAVSFSNMFAMLMMNVRERKREMAILRSVGARPHQLVGLVVSEAAIICLSAITLAIVILGIGIATLSPLIQSEFGISLGFSTLGFAEATILTGTLGFGLIISLIPAWRSYRSSLADGLSIKL